MVELDSNKRETPCCAPDTQAVCCEPQEKSACCDEHGDACGCAAGVADTGSAETVRETVRERYAAAALTVTAGEAHGCGCANEVALSDEHGARVFGGTLYADTEVDGASDAALAASLGCGVPTAVAELREGETVLDLGSGAGADVLISARRVGVTGRAIGLDMTEEMLELARRNASESGVSNVEFRKGYIEEIPLPDASIDVVISNCVINLAADKAKVLREVARVLRPGGRFAVSDVIADQDMDDATRTDMRQWTGCIAGALTHREYEERLQAAGLQDIEIRETHRVHRHAASAIIRARRPLRQAAGSRKHPKAFGGTG